MTLHAYTIYMHRPGKAPLRLQGGLAKSEARYLAHKLTNDSRDFTATFTYRFEP